MSALKKQPSRRKEGICGGAGEARTPIYARLPLMVGRFSVESVYV